jgi:hypothetical protein
MRGCCLLQNNIQTFAIMFLLIVPVVCCAETISDKGYYAVVLERRNALQGRSIDAVVFTRSGSTYRLIRRLDEDYRLVVNATSGMQAPAVTAGNFPSYDAMIKGNHLIARTIRDSGGRELAIVYCGLNPCYIERQIRDDGSVLFDIKGSIFVDHKSLGVLNRAVSKD